MSQLVDDARVTILLADYISHDGTGCLHAIRSGLQVFPYIMPAQVSAPMAVGVQVDLPSPHYQSRFSVELCLEDEKSRLAHVREGAPGLVEGEDVIRVGHALTAEEPQFPGLAVPRYRMQSRSTLIMNFAAGLPLDPDRVYQWRVKIDSQSKPAWVVPFFVLPPVPGPVFG